MSISMKNKYNLCVFASLVLWAVVTYFLLLNPPPNIDKKKHKQTQRQQLRELQAEMRDLIESNNQFINRLRLEQLQAYVNRTKQLGSLGLPLDQQQQHQQQQQQQQQHQQDVNRSHNNATDTKMFKQLSTRRRLSNGQPVIAVLVLSCNRVTVRRCIDQLLKYRSSAEQFPIVVSQDCGHQQTSDVIERYGDRIFHIKQPDQSDIDVPPREKKFKGYFKIARHYGWALNEIFFRFNFDTAIVVEDDLDVAPDFYEYFLGTHPILEADPSLWCVSAWNDNGKPELIDERGPHRLYRTDFFPGLGWMLTRRLWEELAPKWPKAYWDDWIRQPEQRKDRACIRPELPRTKTFGKIGVSNGMFYEKHLRFIKLNEQFVPFTKMNLSYLLRDIYDVDFVDQVYRAPIVSLADLKSNDPRKELPANEVRVPYYSRQQYRTQAKMLGLMDDFKSGVPRTGYRGIVSFHYRGYRVHLAPGSSWTGYDIS
ncbi:alpha-1,3-mannosyl-glycoprotein 2-beta-N-acetylglucosaminyltransferase isoform X2 [Trichogramma pretiosum]|uniref:alpha-1,3-mannosyl-glycoprotein 2-beta-N-acetylglucosaminyltransferase isoform X2 n=1 Tax=Trichogramma pretiosum TaxID=7493 RepID=UPI0006C97D98|nr:alpha-1,3-mannosyl-glycoprotein 2-beta-N-acetylglucosaminyltransferase isoform X2 [Trichogramma pretiosum]